MTDNRHTLSPTARVETGKVLKNLDPFLLRYHQCKEEYAKARLAYRSTSPGRFSIAFLGEGHIAESAKRGIAIANLCHASADGMITISAEDLLFAQHVDPADVDLAIDRLERLTEERKAQKAEDEIRIAGIRKAVARRQKIKVRVALVIGICSLVLVAVSIRGFLS